jgi:2Fe-2S ferredoxin
MHEEETGVMAKMSFEDAATRYGAEPGGGAPTKVKITFVDSQGQARTVEGEVGSTAMETARRNDIPEIAAECGGACACATCHVYVDEKWIEKTGKASQMEEDMLDFAFDVKQNSRLCCQITVRPELDGLIVTTPAQQG